MLGDLPYCDRDNMESWKDDCVVPWIGWMAHGRLAARGTAYIIGTHLNAQAQAQIMADSMLKSWIITQVKNQNFPALCRDLPTRDFFRAIGCDAEFWGCVTQRMARREVVRDKGVIHVDMPPEYPASIKHGVGSNTASCVPCRQQKAKARLDLYARADHVHTTRLHCYLPCIAMGTNATLYPEYVTYGKERLTGFI